jgi:beta-lactam-binding protein with PASTA domain/serine/threonine protein kinase
VYRSRQIDLDREVAVKVLSVTDDAFVRRFGREAKTLGKLSQNPGIVTVYDTGVSSTGHPYLILELCSTSVDERLRSDGRFDPIEACSAVAQVADAVADAHAIGVIHRDLKPGNMLQSSNGRFMVTDFGISTVSGATMGQTESVGFTAGYVAPETLIRDEPAGTPADVYALGATLFHMVAGRAAFVDPEKNSNLLALAQRVIHDPVADLRPDGVPVQVCEVIERAMAKDPADRPTAAELGDLLRAVLAELDPTTVDADTPSLTGTRPRRPPADSMVIAVGPNPVAEDAVPANASTLSLVLPPAARATSPDSDTLESVDGGSLLDGANPSSMTDLGPPSAMGVGDGGAAAPTVTTDPGGEWPDADPLRTPVLAPVAADPAPGLAVPEVIDDERRISMPVLVLGAMVGLFALAAVGALLWIGLAGDGEGDGSDVEVVAGPHSTLDPSQDPSAGRQDTGNRGTLDPFGSGADGALLDPIAIPDVIGRLADAAEATLRDAGFAVTRVGEPSSVVARGRVARQSPEGGEEMVPGGVVTIYVSTGRAARTVRVPELTGLTVAEATDALTAVGFNVEEAPEFDDTIPSGQVIDSVPAGGSRAAAGATVTLLVSQGPADDCAAAIGLTEAAATTRLEAAGLTVTSTLEASSTVAEGRVVRCTAVEQAAELTVSSGPSLCIQVIGRSRAEAETALETAGYTVNAVAVERDDLPVGQVFNCTLTDGTASLRYAVAPPRDCPASVVGSTVAQATTALEAVGIGDVTVSSASSPTVPKGRVISCSISGSTASLITSSGPAAPPISVPDLVGMTRTQAQAELGNVGLPPGQVVEAASTRPKGEVVRTNPTAGTSVPADTVVVLTVSFGPETATVPAVIGLTLAQAETALNNAGFVPSVVNQVVPADDPAIGRVVASSPQPGTIQPVGSTVTITVAVGPSTRMS